MQSEPTLEACTQGWENDEIQFGQKQAQESSDIESRRQKDERCRPNRKGAIKLK
jgi:hypothetical protein